MFGPYVVKYAILPSNQIENDLRPNDDRINLLNETQEFFIKLEGSIIREGFRNPIVVTATRKKISNRYGGSRLMIAQKHYLEIPCIIADFDNVFPDAKVLNGIDQIRSYFIDQPRKIIFKPYGINMSGCEHIHLKEET